ncbi:chemotaxis protein CheD [Lederbergia ruris]|uniref:Probable chemoreceptor glutamine deamidase CheD n=1 Tax=Lederbergia ruris TaxID=217495 RepID=A0ABQ4KK25_9BACI|nr:chemotaxis protein CheD [Lederbergia ruris]GIN57806.1 chemoreceptor glutamine deamidase CheD [Lederbergia ruris]
MIETVVRVGIADMNVVKAPNTIRTAGLGSCVGVVIYDQQSQVAGLAHIMLPESSLAKGSQQLNVAKFADTSIKKLVMDLLAMGAIRHQLKAKIAGGAQMFHFTKQTEQMRIGPRNVEAVKRELKNLNIPLVGEDTGGNSGRTIEFVPESSILYVRKAYHEAIEI